MGSRYKVPPFTLLPSSERPLNLESCLLWSLPIACGNKCSQTTLLQTAGFPSGGTLCSAPPGPQSSHGGQLYRVTSDAKAPVVHCESLTDNSSVLENTKLKIIQEGGSCEKAAQQEEDRSEEGTQETRGQRQVLVCLF